MNRENERQQGHSKEQPQISCGGRTCCVPHCHNNSRRNPELSFYKISQEPLLKKKWLKILKIKGLCNPSPNHQVRSAHFTGGKNAKLTIMNANQRENVMDIDHKEETLSCDMIPSTFSESTSSTISPSCHQESNESAQSLAENIEQNLQHLQAKYDSYRRWKTSYSAWNDL